MKKYNILEPIVLGFMGHYDTEDRLVDSGDLRFDGKQITLNGEVSITTNNAIDIWLATNKIEGVK